jgi:hypothetical protein
VGAVVDIAGSRATPRRSAQDQHRSTGRIMAHRDDHAATLARAAALERDLKRARVRAERAERQAKEAERRTKDAERRATDAERWATAVATQVPQATEAELTATPAADEDHRPDGGVVFIHLLLILAASVGAVLGAMWLMLM